MAVETKEEFEAWLKTQSPEMCALIATRAAVRVFPITSHPQKVTKHTETLAILTARAVVTSGVAARFPTPEVSAAARAALSAAEAAADPTDYNDISDAAYAAARAAAYAAYDAADAAITATIACARAADATRAAYGTLATHDASASARAAYAADAVAYADSNLNFVDLSAVAIWNTPTEPDWLLKALEDRSNFLDSSPAWAFWRDWYRGWLTGKQIDWELQRRVALIDNAIWEAGPEAVAAEVERIKADYLAEKAPQAERIELNEDTGKFFAVPLDVAKPDLLGATLTQVQDAFDDVLANPSNGLRDTSRETRVLYRVFTRYDNDPQQIEMGFVSAYKGLTRQILSEELPKSEENLALQDALQEGARGIRATHPEVAENRKILTEQAIREMRPEDIELIEDARPVLAAISDEDLADDWNTDIPQLLNDATTPLPSGAPPLPGADEATRIFSRVSKMKLRYDKITEKGAEIFDSKGFKTIRLGLTVSGLLSALVSLGLFILGIV